MARDVKRLQAVWHRRRLVAALDRLALEGPPDRVDDLVARRAYVAVEPSMHIEGLGSVVERNRDLLRVDVEIGQPVDEACRRRAPVAYYEYSPVTALNEKRRRTDEHHVNVLRHHYTMVVLEAHPRHDHADRVCVRVRVTGTRAEHMCTLVIRMPRRGHELVGEVLIHGKALRPDGLQWPQPLIARCVTVHDLHTGPLSRRQSARTRGSAARSPRRGRTG